MGRSMCENLIKFGPPGRQGSLHCPFYWNVGTASKVTVFTRTPSKAASLKDLGATVANSPKAGR
jgi:3-hydroxyisobutyrate dehydrogenase-like beta-hydroxyacid dehydrogenase